MERDPEGFKRAMQEAVAKQMIAAGIDPVAFAAQQRAQATTPAASASLRRRAGAGPSGSVKNPFTGEELEQTLNKHEMPFGMPGTYYGPGEEEDEGQLRNRSAGHNHSHGGGHNHGDDAHGHNHGDAHNHGHGHDHGHGHNHDHGHNHAGHNHSRNHNHGDGHNHDEIAVGDESGHNHNHGGHNHNDHHNHGGDSDGHNHSHGNNGDASNEDGHNHAHHNHGHNHNHNHGHNHGDSNNRGHSHGEAADHGHNHNHIHDRHRGGHNHGDHSGHNHGDHSGHNRNHNHDVDNSAANRGDASNSASHPSNQQFGDKHGRQAHVATEDSQAAKDASIYSQPTLQVLSDGVRDGLATLRENVIMGDVKLSIEPEAYQLCYATAASKRPHLPGLPVTSSSLTFLPLSLDGLLDPTEIDLAERTSDCHLCIMAMQPFPTKTPTQEDIRAKQALYATHVRVGRGLEQQFEMKEIVPSNPPLPGAPAEASMESLGPDCSIEIHSYQTKLKYLNPLDRAHGGCTHGGNGSNETSLDGQTLTELQSTFGLGPSKSSLKKAKAKLKKSTSATSTDSNNASQASSGGGFLSSITSIFTGSSSTPTTAPQTNNDEQDEEEEETNNNADNTTSIDKEEKDDGGSSSVTSKSKKRSKKLDGETEMTVVQLLVRCAPPCSSGEGFQQALSDRDPLKMYRFEFASVTPHPSSQAPNAPTHLAAYQAAIDFVMAFLHRTHPPPQPTQVERDNFTVKDRDGTLRHAPMPVRQFPSHVAIWTDRCEWTGVPRAPFVAKKLPDQDASIAAAKMDQAIVPSSTHLKLNHNLFFTPPERTKDFATAKTLAVTEQATATHLLASFWKSYQLKEINLHIFPQGHGAYLYKSFNMIEKEVEARAAYFAKGKYRSKKLFKNERLDIQLQFEPTAEEVAMMEEAKERRDKGLPPLDDSAKVQLEAEVDEVDLSVPIRRFLVI